MLGHNDARVIVGDDYTDETSERTSARSNSGSGSPTDSAAYCSTDAGCRNDASGFNTARRSSAATAGELGVDVDLLSINQRQSG